MIGTQTSSGVDGSSQSGSAEKSKHPLVVLVWGSNLPSFLKPFASKLAAMSDRRGTGKFQYTISVRSLVESNYFKDGGPRSRVRSYCERSIQYFLRALEYCGFLEIISNGAGQARTFVLHPEALATVWMTDPMLRPPHARPRYQGTLRSKRDRAQAAKAAKQEPSAAPPPLTPIVETPRQIKPPPTGDNHGVIGAVLHELLNKPTRADYTTADLRDALEARLRTLGIVFKHEYTLDTVIASVVRSRLVDHDKWVPPSVRPDLQAKFRA